MLKNKLSIIIPYCNEFPQVYFTICNLRCELEQSDIDWEIIAIANKNTDAGYERVSKIPDKRINSLKYDTKLSHWCAKNEGIKAATGNIFFFIDSHCIVAKNALINMYNFYTEHLEELHGTLHMPILYMNEKSGRELEYKLQANITDKKIEGDLNNKNTPHNLHYSFTRYKHVVPFHRVSCMSTCGMMISRKLLINELNMWPDILDIYGGGENFINFSLAVMGYHINVFHRPNCLHHYADKRGYSWTYDSWVKNRIAAAYIYGGESWAHTFALNVRGRKEVLEKMYLDVLTKCRNHHEHIHTRTKLTPQQWVEQEYAAGRFKSIYK